MAQVAYNWGYTDAGSASVSVKTSNWTNFAVSQPSESQAVAKNAQAEITQPETFKISIGDIKNIYTACGEKVDSSLAMPNATGRSLKIQHNDVLRITEVDAQGAPVVGGKEYCVPFESGLYVKFPYNEYVDDGKVMHSAIKALSGFFDSDGTSLAARYMRGAVAPKEV